MFQDRVPDHFPTTIPPPVWTVPLSAEEKREIKTLDERKDEDHDFLWKHGVAKQFGSEWYLPVKWRRGGKFVYHEKMDVIMASKYGQIILNNWQTVDGFWEEHVELYNFMPSLRVPAARMTKFEVGDDLVRLDTQQHVRVIRLHDDLVFPWMLDTQALYVEHVLNDGSTDRSTGGSLSDKEVSLFSPSEQSAERADESESVIDDDPLEEATDLLLVKIGKKMNRLLKPQNVSREKKVEQDIPPLFIQQVFLRTVEQQGVVVTKNKSAKNLTFSVTDATILVNLLPNEYLIREQGPKYFFVACTDEDPVQFKYSWSTTSQTLRVVFTVNERKGDGTILSV